MTQAIDAAEALGQLQERIWWRTRPVPGTESKAHPDGRSPEQLALERQPQREALRSRNEGRAETNARRHHQAMQEQAQAQELADARWRDRPEASRSAVAARIHPELRRRWAAEDERLMVAGEICEPRLRHSQETVRKRLKKAVRA